MLIPPEIGEVARRLDRAMVRREHLELHRHAAVADGELPFRLTGSIPVLPETMACITSRFMNTISLKLPDRLLERLESESRARGTTKSSLVRECLEKSLDAGAIGGKATCYDLARDLAGSLKGLPRELATNPKHMKGFGR